jgi:hypothetical protein
LFAFRIQTKLFHSSWPAIHSAARSFFFSSSCAPIKIMNNASPKADPSDDKTANLREETHHNKKWTKFLLLQIVKVSSAQQTSF